MIGSVGDAKEIFLAALDFESPEALARHLEVSCGGDTALRARVEELLNARQAAGSFLGGDWSPPPQDTTPVEETPGETIGHYKLIEQIGEGGFGVVFRAEQQRPVRRDVALKIIKLGMDTKQVVARFEAERQALAMMDHPGIAKVFDAGSTGSGRAYFVMELVRGVNITDYCDRRQLGIDQRLALFVQTCQAVQHAHQKGLIHRDLKPSNVLVGEVDSHPIVKVIDFGIAKATQARLTEKSHFTDLRQLVGTPEYMSPEQAGGSPDIDTRSDVYSLGVLLYELLTGAPPLDPKELRSKAFAEVQRLIREIDPPTPSSRLSSLPDTLPSVAARRAIEPRRLDALIRGDLDWITMKALEKDRARRYESAAALAADVMHHLADEPVAAAAPSRLYRWGKFVQRNKLAVGATAAVMTALLAGIVGTTIGMIGQSRQRAAAEGAREQLQAVNNFLTEDVLGAADPSRIPDKAVRDQIVKVMIDPAAATVARRFRGKPLVEAAVRLALAGAYEGVGRGDLAVPHARQSLALRRRELGENHSDTVESSLALGNLLRSLGQFDEAAPLLRDSLDRIRRGLGNNDDNTIVALTSMAIWHQEQGNFAAAEPLYRESLERTRREYDKDHVLAIMSTNNLGYVLLKQGKLAAAEPFVVETLERAQRVLKENHRGTMRAISNMGMLLTAQGNYAEAESYWRKGVELTRGVLGDDDPYTLTAITDLAGLLMELGFFDETEQLAREALAGRQRVLWENHPDTLASLGNLGLLLRRRGRLDEAERYSSEALERTRRYRDENHPDTLYALTNMGTLSLAQNRLDRAESYLLDALERCENHLPVDHPLTPTAVFNLADLRHSQGRLDEAKALYEQALTRRRDLLGSAHPDTLYALHGLAILLQRQGEIERAEPMIREALVGYMNVFGPQHWQVGVAHMHLGRALTALARFSDAEPELLKAEQILSDAEGSHEERHQHLVEDFVRLYDAMETAEPGQGHAANAQLWRSKLPAATTAAHGIAAAVD